ncbi:MAG TPA: hypothetical protein VFL57_12710 [Bryobacteraceae bacterium]|nr:hypothetical protein [Bryobacteraceae bacterium]
MRWLALLAFLAAVNPDELERMTARFAPVKLQVDTTKLPPGDRAALVPLIRAAYVIDTVFLTQFWSGNHELLAKLKNDTTPLGRARLLLFWIEKGPWSSLDHHKAFLPGVPECKPECANFYAPDITKEEFERWVANLSERERQDAQGFFTTIRRTNGTLTSIPYADEYRNDMVKLATLLREASMKTENATLKRFLNLRADAFLSNDYYESDVAWMDLDAPLDITIGPYETYNDELFGYKAAFEAYITVRDDRETAKVRFFSEHLQEIEDNLPVDPKYRNPKLGALAPIRVVNQIIATGDAAHGVRTAAFNLPNDERVIKEKGSKRVMLRNVQEAKFNSILVPIAKRVLPAAAQADLSFDSFFTHILAHELTHGIGPHDISVGGRSTSPRRELKELYSAIEEAKADVCGLFMLQYMYERNLLPGGAEFERKLYTTYLASAFRTLRFGINEAHGRGMALQVNYLTDKGAFRANADGTFAADFGRIKTAVRDLARDLLTLEAMGDYAGAQRMLDTYAKLRPDMSRAIEGLREVPTDIAPINVTADAIVRPPLP